MDSRQIDVLAIHEHRMVLVDTNEVPVRDLRGGWVASRTHLPGGRTVLGVEFILAPRLRAAVVSVTGARCLAVRIAAAPIPAFVL
jgi:hypothetical protein